MSQLNSIIMFNKLKGISFTDKNPELSYVTKKVKNKLVSSKSILLFAKQEDDNIKCPHCGSQPIKYGKTREVKINHGDIDGFPSYIVMKKQRYQCKCCKKTFQSQTNLTKKFCNISESKKARILMDLSEKKSVTLIAKESNVSTSTVQRILNSANTYTENQFNFLPKVMSIDEFRAFSSKKAAKFALAIVDCEKHKLVDICVDRKLGYLRRYFNRYPLYVRKKVEMVCMDMHQPYITLVKEMFPNAKIALDRFHIVQNMSRAINNYRIQIMKRIDQNNDKELYKIFKKYGMLITKRRDKLEVFKARWVPHMQTRKTEEYLLNKMLETDAKLYNSYWLYQTMMSGVKLKSMELIDQVIKDDVQVCSTMDIAIKTMSRYRQYIKNALETPFSNGPIEAYNNNIKVVKRIAYGYRNFQNFRNRILLVNTDIIRRVA